MTGPELRRLRTKAKLTQEAAAGLLGITRKTVNRWEKGHVAIPTLKVPAVRKTLANASA